MLKKSIVLSLSEYDLSCFALENVFFSPLELSPFSFITFMQCKWVSFGDKLYKRLSERSTIYSLLKYLSVYHLFWWFTSERISYYRTHSHRSNTKLCLPLYSVFILRQCVSSLLFSAKWLRYNSDIAFAFAYFDFQFLEH